MGYVIGIGLRYRVHMGEEILLWLSALSLGLLAELGMCCGSRGWLFSAIGWLFMAGMCCGIALHGGKCEELLGQSNSRSRDRYR